jgi:hypothetical protein
MSKSETQVKLGERIKFVGKAVLHVPFAVLRVIV